MPRASLGMGQDQAPVPPATCARRPCFALCVPPARLGPGMSGRTLGISVTHPAAEDLGATRGRVEPRDHRRHPHMDGWISIIIIIVIIIIFIIIIIIIVR